MQGAIALTVFRDQKAVGALVAALDDPGRLVRRHAALALFAAHGLPDDSDSVKPASEHMLYRVMAEDAARREGAKRDILAAIAERKIVSE